MANRDDEFWPTVMVDVDEDAPADPFFVGICAHCERNTLYDELYAHCGEWVCEDCRFHCTRCGDEPVWDEGSMCYGCKEEAEEERNCNK